jgi:YVTN family beta-propeller protein
MRWRTSCSRVLIDMRGHGWRARGLAKAHLVLAAVVSALAAGCTRAPAAGESQALAASSNASVPPGRGELVYVTNERSSTLSVIDPTNDRAMQSIAIDGRPRGIHASADGSRIYVAISRENEDEAVREGVLELDAVSGRIVAVHPVGNDPEDFALGSQPPRLYVANEQEGTASVVDLPSGRMVKAVHVDAAPEGVGISPDGRWVFVTAQTANTVSVLDTRSAERVGSFEVDARPRRAAFTPDGRLALVTAENGRTLSVVDVGRRAVVGRYSFPESSEQPLDVVASPDGRRAYVATGRADAVAVLDLSEPSQPTRLATIAVGDDVQGLGLTADGRKLYAANSGSNDVSVIDTATGRVVATITVGDGPWGVCLGKMPRGFTTGGVARSR